MSPARLPVVAVLGSGREPHAERAEALGRWLATLDAHLLTGGGGGVMAAVSRAFHDARPRRGLVIGVLPGHAAGGAPEPPRGYPNPWVELAIRTHLPLSGERGTEPQSRNHLNVLSADVVVALPGSRGTASEVALALGYGRRVIAWLDRRGEIDGLPEGARVEPDFAEVRRFVLDALAGCRAG